MNGVNFSGARLVRGVHGGNLESVATELASGGAGLTDGIDRSERSGIAEDLKALKVAVNHARPSREGLAKADTATAFMLAGAMLGGTGGPVSGWMLQQKLHEVVSDPGRLSGFATRITDAQSEAPPQLGSLNARVTQALVKDGVKPGNVPTALLMSGVLLEADQNRGLLPGS